MGKGINSVSQRLSKHFWGDLTEHTSRQGLSSLPVVTSSYGSSGAFGIGFPEQHLRLLWHLVMVAYKNRIHFCHLRSQIDLLHPWGHVRVHALLIEVLCPAMAVCWHSVSARRMLFGGRLRATRWKLIEGAWQLNCGSFLGTLVGRKHSGYRISHRNSCCKCPSGYRDNS